MMPIENVLIKLLKTRIFKEFSIWDMLTSKVRMQQPDDTRKRMQRMFEEVELILSMFDTVVKKSHPANNVTGELTVEQLLRYNFVLPDICISKFMSIPPNRTRIFFINDSPEFLVKVT